MNDINLGHTILQENEFLQNLKRTVVLRFLFHCVYKRDLMKIEKVDFDKPFDNRTGIADMIFLQLSREQETRISVILCYNFFLRRTLY